MIELKKLDIFAQRLRVVRNEKSASMRIGDFGLQILDFEHGLDSA